MLSDPERYRRLLEAVTNNATVALFIMDEQQHCVFLNPAAEELTGFQLEDFAGKPMHEVLHHARPDGSPYPIEECPIDRAFSTNRQQQGEEMFVHRDGSFYPVAYTASPVRDEGAIRGTVVEVRDIRRERQAEEERARIVAREKRSREEAEKARRDALQLAEELQEERDKLQAINERLTESNRELALVGERLRQEQERLADLTQYLRSATRTAVRMSRLSDPRAMAEVCLETLQTVFQPQVAGIWLTEPGSRKLKLCVSHGLDTAPTHSLEQETDVVLNAYKLGWVARLRRPFLGPIQPDDPQVDQPWAHLWGLKYAGIYPLAGRELLHGVLVLFTQEEFPLGSEEVLATLAAIFAGNLDQVNPLLSDPRG